MVVLHHVLQFLIGRRTILLRLGEDQLGQILLADLQVGVLGILVEDDLRANPLDHALVDVRPEIIGGLGLLILGLGQVLVQGEPRPGQLLLDGVATSLLLVRHQPLRQFELGALQDGLQN